MSLKADLQAFACSSKNHGNKHSLMSIQDARSDDYARGHQVMKNACVQLKLGVGTDGPSHY